MIIIRVVKDETHDEAYGHDHRCIKGRGLEEKEEVSAISEAGKETDRLMR
jgi:hypothetical protein